LGKIPKGVATQVPGDEAAALVCPLLLLCWLALLESKGKPRRRRNRELRLGMEFKGAVG
jgi:hypothetical protein